MLSFHHVTDVCSYRTSNIVSSTQPSEAETRVEFDALSVANDVLALAPDGTPSVLPVRLQAVWGAAVAHAVLRCAELCTPQALRKELEATHSRNLDGLETAVVRFSTAVRGCQIELG